MRFSHPIPVWPPIRGPAWLRPPWLLLLPLLCLYNPQAPAANALAGNPSPYLAMHGEDPVDWHPFGPDALDKARRENKPLFISSGYFACHWCHVMQRETYRNPRVATRLNRDFVPVKLDRELDPALDSYLIDFVERTAGQAGWPLNVFLTPEGYPMLGLTYAPAAEFEAVLERVVDHWSHDSQSLRDLARRAAEERLRDRPPPETAPPVSAAELADRLERQALLNADDLMGGFGRQARFPMAPTLMALLELQASAPDDGLAAFLRLTLDAMGDKGLRDHLGGGFFRYTVDPDWQTPHFEKMLYTQALLVSLYLRAAEVLEVPGYQGVAKDTLDFVLAAMKGRDGGYIASLTAADAAGVEGGYYLWSPEDLRGLLDADEQRFAGVAFGMQGPVGAAGGYLPMGGRDSEQAAVALGLSGPAFAGLREAVQGKLLEARSKRELPRDDKQLAGWNGLVLSALAAATRAFGDADYRHAGSALASYLRDGLWDGRQLHRAVADSGWMGETTLEDYAFVAKGLKDWGSVAGDARDLALSRRLVALAWEAFYADGSGADGSRTAGIAGEPSPAGPLPGDHADTRGPATAPRDHGGSAAPGEAGPPLSGSGSGSGWRLSARPLLPAVPAEPVLADDPLPSPAATLVYLTLLDGDSSLLVKARQALDIARAPTARNPFVFASHAILYLTRAEASASPTWGPAPRPEADAYPRAQGPLGASPSEGVLPGREQPSGVVPGGRSVPE